MLITRALAASVLAAFLTTTLVACGDDDTVGAGSGGSSPGGADDGVFVEVTMFGGFVPVGSDFANPPVAVIYGDGRSFTLGAVPAIFPGPAVTPVSEGEVDSETIDQLLQLAREAGLLDDVAPDYGAAAVIDAPTTRVRVVVDGTAHVVEVVAPELSDDPQLTEEQRANRRRLAGFIQGVTSAATDGETGIYDPDGYLVLPYAPFESDPGTEPNELAWPFDTLVENECQAVEGDAVATLEDLLPEATQITRWVSDGESWQLAIRPLLAHESGCPD